MISPIAATLYNQIPNQVLKAVKAQDVVAFEDGIQFKVKDTGTFNKIVIKYDEGQDLYNMEFWDIDMENFRCEKVDDLNGIYFDQLGDIIMGRVVGQ